MQKLFDPVNGIGLGFLRNPMGASDLARNSYTYDDMPAGQTDPTLAHFTIAHDLAEARRHIAAFGAPVVVKADGLAAGKGVVVAATVAEAEAYLYQGGFKEQERQAGHDTVVGAHIT